ncbi:MAG TPA: tetratricopeptide repeat protein, partial [Stellaceae bacterium]|nr:tetratricopeptide repeat protein [Stellaceae bacterium]
MSSPSTTADGPPATPGIRAAYGEPVFELPRLVEPVPEATPSRRQPRHQFLGPKKPAGTIAQARQVAPLDIPEMIEPEPVRPMPDLTAPPGTEATVLPAADVPAAVPPEAKASASLATDLVALPAAAKPAALSGSAAVLRARKPPRGRALLRDRLPPLPARRAERFAVIAAGAIVLLGLFAAVVAQVGIDPSSRTRRYPVTAAPSDPAKRFAYFQQGAQTGDAESQLQLAILYAKGEGVGQDYPTAATWFRAAADQGLARAQYDMGVLTERGRGVKVDLAEAATWYLKAARAGYPLAQYNLAVCYTKGRGLRQDLPEAALWYRRAALQGVVQAMVNLAMMYEKGEGVTASPVDAYAWFLAAGRRENQAASRRAEDVFSALPHLDQIRAEALASDVAKSIHDPAPGDRPEAASTA